MVVFFSLLSDMTGLVFSIGLSMSTMDAVSVSLEKSPVNDTGKVIEHVFPNNQNKHFLPDA